MSPVGSQGIGGGSARSSTRSVSTPMSSAEGAPAHKAGVIGTQSSRRDGSSRNSTHIRARYTLPLRHSAHRRTRNASQRDLRSLTTLRIAARTWRIWRPRHRNADHWVGLCVTSLGIRLCTRRPCRVDWQPPAVPLTCADHTSYDRTSPGNSSARNAWGCSPCFCSCGSEHAVAFSSPTLLSKAPRPSMACSCTAECTVLGTASDDPTCAGRSMPPHYPVGG